MMRTMRMVGWVMLIVVSTALPASADWLFTGYISQLLQTKTTAAGTVPAERFDDNVGFGANFASAFPTRGNLGFEFDMGIYPKGLHNSDVFGTAFASGLMSISTNFFYSPAVPRVRPYFSGGPNFGYRWDHVDAGTTTPSGWAIGVNGGAGAIVFVNQHFGARVDARYYRNFGDFYDLREEVTTRRTGWNNLQFIRVTVGATWVL